MMHWVDSTTSGPWLAPSYLPLECQIIASFLLSVLVRLKITEVQGIFRDRRSAARSSMVLLGADQDNVTTLDWRLDAAGGDGSHNLRFQFTINGA